MPKSFSYFFRIYKFNKKPKQLNIKRQDSSWVKEAIKQPEKTKTQGILETTRILYFKRTRSTALKPRQITKFFGSSDISRIRS